MENFLAYLIFGTGWPILIVGSIWTWKRSAQFAVPARTFLNIALIAFYVLGYVCTAYWLGVSWIAAVLPAFVVFFILFVVALREVHHATNATHGTPLSTH